MCTGVSKCTSFAMCTFVFPLTWLHELADSSTEPSVMVFQFD